MEGWLWKADRNGQRREWEMKRSSVCRQSFQVFLWRGMEKLDGKYERICNQGNVFLRWELTDIFI